MNGSARVGGGDGRRESPDGPVERVAVDPADDGDEVVGGST
jgi:hypothetical protein